MIPEIIRGLCPACKAPITTDRKIGAGFFNQQKNKTYVSYDCGRCHRHGIGFVAATEKVYDKDVHLMSSYKR